MEFGKCELAIRKRPLENGSFREVIVIDGLIRIITIIRLFVNGNSDFKNLYREGGKRFVDIKERMANVGMTQVDMILELQKRGYAVQPPTVRRWSSGKACSTVFDPSMSKLPQTLKC